MSNPNTVNYSDFNTILKTKRPIASIKKKTAERIGKVLLGDVKGKPSKQTRLDALSDQLKGWSESMKIRLAITVDFLDKQWLLTTNSIKWMTIRDIKKIAWANSDEKIDNIIKYIIDTWRKDGKSLTTEQKEQLNQAVIDWLNEHYWDLAEKEDRSKELEAKNQELEEELNASEAANEVVESSVLTRRSLSNMIRVWKSIENININKKWLDRATKARKVLWQANHSTIFGSWKRFDWTNKLPRKFDIKQEYNSIADKLHEKMWKTKNSQEKIAIRYIMRQANKAYEDYIDAISVDEETRRNNMKEINSKMVA